MHTRAVLRYHEPDPPSAGSVIAACIVFGITILYAVFR